jgi:hypothetical protein
VHEWQVDRGYAWENILIYHLSFESILSEYL